MSNNISPKDANSQTHRRQLYPIVLCRSTARSQIPNEIVPIISPSYTLCTTNQTGGSLSPLFVDHPNLGNVSPTLSLAYSILTPYAFSSALPPHT